tara:strand:- start:66 stop:1019 length:954 start_codon:yes stop_codon:yes gene_type:complete
MTDSTYPATGGFTGTTEAASFIPEIWSDEIIAAYKSNLVQANLVKKMSMVGKKGDTIYIPTPTRGDAHAKTQNGAVTVQGNAEATTTVLVDKHYEYSKLIEDIADIQALSSMRQFYTSDAGYALGKQVDSDLFQLGLDFGDSNGADWVHSNSYFVDASNGLSAYAVDTVVAADVVTDAAFRGLIKLMDDQDVPMDNRSWTIPPSVRQTLMGIDRYVSSDFVSGQPVSNGLIGNLYGVDIYVSSNVPIIETASDNSAGGDVRGSIFQHKDTSVLVEQSGIRSQTQYKQEWLGDLFTADTIYGVKNVRPESGFVLAVNT